jgi:hypothetical protein
MTYNKTTWVEGAAPAINAANLNEMEQGIEDAHKGQLTGVTLLPTTSGNDYPVGITTHEITNDQPGHGWPYQYGMLLNIKSSNGRFTQWFYGHGNGQDGTMAKYRHWYGLAGVENPVWTPWYSINTASDNFYVEKNNAAVIPASTEVRIRMDTVKENTGVWQGVTGSGDNYGFIAKTDGYYSVNVLLQWNANDYPTANYYFYVYEDGVRLRGRVVGYNQKFATFTFSFPVKENKKYEFWVFQYSGGVSKTLEIVHIEGVEVHGL